MSIPSDSPSLLFSPSSFSPSSPHSSASGSENPTPTSGSPPRLSSSFQPSARRTSNTHPHSHEHRTPSPLDVLVAVSLKMDLPIPIPSAASGSSSPTTTAEGDLPPSSKLAVVDSSSSSTSYPAPSLAAFFPPPTSSTYSQQSPYSSESAPMVDVVEARAAAAARAGSASEDPSRRRVSPTTGSNEDEGEVELTSKGKKRKRLAKAVSLLSSPSFSRSCSRSPLSSLSSTDNRCYPPTFAPGLFKCSESVLPCFLERRRGPKEEGREERKGGPRESPSRLLIGFVRLPVSSSSFFFSFRETGACHKVEFFFPRSLESRKVTEADPRPSSVFFAATSRNDAVQARNAVRTGWSLCFLLLPSSLFYQDGCFTRMALVLTSGPFFSFFLFFLDPSYSEFSGVSLAVAYFSLPLSFTSLAKSNSPFSSLSFSFHPPPARVYLRNSQRRTRACSQSLSASVQLQPVRRKFLSSFANRLPLQLVRIRLPPSFAETHRLLHGSQHTRRGILRRAEAKTEFRDE